MQQLSHIVIAFYIFTPIEDPHLLVRQFQDFFENKEIFSRIYISEEGINAQMSATKEAGELFMVWLKQDPRFTNVFFKIDPYHEQVFPHKRVKYRKQLVALDMKVDVAETATHLSPEEWSCQLDKKDENLLLLDVRNDYEGKIGHFEGSIVPPLETFREFPKYVESLKNQYDTKKTKILMCCTGGIRCELFSVVMKKAGFEQVYQLDGGIINYGHKKGNKHWKGKLYVFDDRVAVPIAPPESEEDLKPISHCHCCDELSDTYYNCAHLKCNKHFISCSACAQKLKGCCSTECMDCGDFVRPFTPVEGQPKPFKRLHTLRA